MVVKHCLTLWRCKTWALLLSSVSSSVNWTSITSCQRFRRSWVSRRKAPVQREISLLLIAEGSFLSARKWTRREWERLFLSSQYGCPAKHPGKAAKRAEDVPGNGPLPAGVISHHTTASPALTRTQTPARRRCSFKTLILRINSN